MLQELQTCGGVSPTTSRPADELKKRAENGGHHFADREFARKLDQEDPLKHLRSEFCIPRKKDLPGIDEALIGEEECIYFCNNGLGLMPQKAHRSIDEELSNWAHHGALGIQLADNPWVHSEDSLAADMAELVGCKREECVLMNGLTVNLHLLLIAFYRPTQERHKILLETGAFPSDHYCVESEVRLKGYDPKSSMLFVSSRKDESTLRTEDILRLLDDEGDSIAVVFLPGIHFFTGQLFDMKTITRAAQNKGCYVGFDIAHAVGNVELKMHDWNLDFAVWCTNKYVCAGYGGVGGAYIHERHAHNEFPRLTGWWGHELSTRYVMDNKMVYSPGAAGYHISTPPVLLYAILKSSLEVFKMTSMQELRKKSKLLTGYLEMLLLHHFPRPSDGLAADSAPYVEVMTPRDPDQRGCQLSLVFSVPTKAVYTELLKRGVVVDTRQPNVMRVAPAPLCNTFNDVYRFIELLREVLSEVHPLQDMTSS